MTARRMVRRQPTETELLIRQAVSAIALIVFLLVVLVVAYVAIVIAGGAVIQN